LLPVVESPVGDIHIVIGLLTDVLSRVEVGVVSNAARQCSVGVLAVDKVVSVVGVGGAEWGSWWKRYLFRYGWRCLSFD
jgi:hypothetical protein